MGMLSVDYDLASDGKQDYSDLIEALESYETGRRLTKSHWLIKTERTPKQVVEHLKPFLGQGDKLIVMPVAVPALWDAYGFSDDQETVVWLLSLLVPLTPARAS